MFGSPNEEDKAAAAAEADSTVNGKAQDDASTDSKSIVADDDKSLGSNQGNDGPVAVKASSDVKADVSVAEVGAGAKQATENETAAPAVDATTASEKIEVIDETKTNDTEGSEAAAADTNAAEADGKRSENAGGEKESAEEVEGSPSAVSGDATEEADKGKEEGGSGGGADVDGEPKGYVGGTVVTWAAATANLREALLAALGVGGAESVQWAEAVKLGSLSFYIIYSTFAFLRAVSFPFLRSFSHPFCCCDCPCPLLPLHFYLSLLYHLLLHMRHAQRLP